MARLSIEHDAVDDDANARTRRRSIALRLDGGAWLRVEPEALGELGVAEGDEIDADRRAEVEETLARIRARLFVVRSLAVEDAVDEPSSSRSSRRATSRADIAREAIERVAGYGYVDDASLAGQLARGMRTRGYGRRRAEQKLRARGLRDLSPRRLSTRPTATGDEVELAREALGRRSPRGRRRSPTARRRVPRPPRLLGGGGVESRPERRPRSDRFPAMRDPTELSGQRWPRRGRLSRARRRPSRHSNATVSRLFVDLTHPSDPLDDYRHAPARRPPASHTRFPTWGHLPRAT